MATIDEIKAAMRSIGPKQVETKEFNAEQFNPLDIQRLVERTQPAPTFNSMTRVVVQSNRALQDCPCSGECDNC